MKQQVIEKYAKLVLKKGVNLQKDQPLVINGPIEGAYFVRELAKQAYVLGAKEVHVNWADDTLTYLTYKHANEEVFQTYPQWKVMLQESYAEQGAAFISIHATDPDLLQDVDATRIAEANKSAGTALKTYREYIMNDKVCWTVISIPTTGWAKKVFPQAKEEEAVQLLWDEIVKMVRVNEDDPITAWDLHNATLKNANDYLNEKQYEKIVLKAKGTNLEVGLPKKHIWAGGAAEAQNGTVFNPNMPTEEVFTAPHKYNVNGVVSSTKPLNYGGNVIDEFELTFQDGMVVDYQAKQGEETLKHLLASDDGAKRLGELALVPHESPVSQSGHIFYNTLFDENASVHIALGKAYPTNVTGGPEMDDAKLDENGINDSMIHVDFMIGSADMDIDGVTADGKVEPIFKDGTWAIKF